MSQRNNSGRHAQLDEHKRRAAGRANTGERRETSAETDFARGKTAGAFGKKGVANRGQQLEEPSARGDSNVLDIGKSTRPGRKRAAG
jgi:hypothetical protein